MNMDRIAGIADTILGAWLVLSMSLWRDTSAQVVTTGIVGMVAVVFGLGSVQGRGRPWLRWVVAVAGVWLFLASFILPGISVRTVINHLFVGTLLFGFSALPTGRGRQPGGIL